jgi:L-asparaginase
MERWLSSLSLSGSTMLSGKLAAYKHRLADSYKYFTEEEKPNVLILFCGGTIIMKASADGSLIVPEDKEEAVQLLIDLEPLVDEIANLDVKFIENIDSTNMNNRIWDKIGQVIDDNYDSYDGFVITHGTDTLAYTASALSFSLGDLGKPVCITGAQIPGGRLETDARMNFVNAVRIATLKKAGVMVVFNESVILGARSHKMSESKLNAFGSMNRHNYGEIRVDIRFREEAKDRHGTIQ